MFAFHPIRTRGGAALAIATGFPMACRPRGGAVFLPQAETALNLVMDGAPLFGERVLVFVQGVVGLLTARLLAEFPLARLVPPNRWRGGANWQESAAFRKQSIHRCRNVSFPGRPEGSGPDFRVVRRQAGSPGHRSRPVSTSNRVGSWYGSITAADRAGVSSQPAAPHFQPGEHLNPALTGAGTSAGRIDLRALS